MKDYCEFKDIFVFDVGDGLELTLGSIRVRVNYQDAEFLAEALKEMIPKDEQ